MEECIRCESSNLLQVNSKSNDCNQLIFDNKEHIGYLPRDLNIGGGDTIEFVLCLNCGTIQGEFPIPFIVLDKIFDF